MDCVEAILSRRSIRRYQAESLADDTLETLLRAGMAAPSARNLQPWEFIVVTRRQTLGRMAAVIPYGKMLPQAAVAILICGNTRRSMDESQPLYWVLDCAAAAENILLAAHGLGLGGVWLGVFPRRERMHGMTEVFRLPAHIIPHSVMCLGWPAEEGVIKDKYDPGKVHREAWSERVERSE